MKLERGGEEEAEREEEERKGEREGDGALIRLSSPPFSSALLSFLNFLRITEEGYWEMNILQGSISWVFK